MWKPGLIVALLVAVAAVGCGNPNTIENPDDAPGYEIERESIDDSGQANSAEAVLIASGSSEAEIRSVAEDYASKHPDLDAVRLRIASSNGESVASADYSRTEAGERITGLPAGEQAFEYIG